MRFEKAYLFELHTTDKLDALGNPQYKLVQVEEVKARAGDLTLQEVDLLQRFVSQATMKVVYRGNQGRGTSARYFAFADDEEETLKVHRIENVEIGKKWNTLYLSDWKEGDEYDRQDILFL